MNNKKLIITTVSLIVLGIQFYFNASLALYDVSDIETRLNTLNTYKYTYEKYLRQIEQYNTQIEQYKNQIQNTNSLSEYEWHDVNRAITELLEIINTLNEFEEDGGLEGYLDQFQDIEHYQSSSCYSASGCTEEEREALQANQSTGSSAQKQANDAMIQGLVLQQDNLENEAQELESLQGKATTAEGQMAAIQYANQLASSQANQLMQIRALLIAEQTAAASRAQVIADREAQQAAASEQLRAGTYQDSPERNWLGVMP